MLGHRLLPRPRPGRRLLPPLLVLAAAMTLTAAPPDWWTQPDAAGAAAINPAATDANPNGPANIGQAKFMAKRALDSLSAIDPALAARVYQKLTVPQAGPSAAAGLLAAIIDFEVPGEPLPASWHASQHTPLLLGQLKALATPFYDILQLAAPRWLDHPAADPAQQGQLQLNATKDPAAPSNPYPWSADPADDQNQAPATIGQLKAVFSLHFESLNATLDSDNDGLTNAAEESNGTNPRQSDTDGDGITDAWELTWGLNPLDAADAAADPDGDNLTSLGEFHNGTVPTGCYRIEVLPMGANQYFHSAADDGSVVMQAALAWDPASTLEQISAPDATGTRTLSAVPPCQWQPPATLAAGLVVAGILEADDELTPSGPDSSTGTYRVFQANAGMFIFREPGTYVGSLSPQASWQAIDNHGRAIAISLHLVAAAEDEPEHLETQLLISDGTTTSAIALPAGGFLSLINPTKWLLAAATPSILAFSDDNNVLIRQPVMYFDHSISCETILLAAGQSVFTRVSQPGLGYESIVAVSPTNARMLGTGPTPFQITPDGTLMLLATLPITTGPTVRPVPLGSLYPNPLVPHHICSDGRITLTTTDADGQPILLQLFLYNDTDSDHMMDDWEVKFARMLLELGKPEADWGALYAGLVAGNLDAAADYTGEQISAAEIARLCNRPPAQQSPDGVEMQFQARSNSLACGIHVTGSPDAPESNEGMLYLENAGCAGAALELTSYAQLLPEYLATQILANPWEYAPTGQAWSRFTIEPRPGAPLATNYAGTIRQARFRLVTDTMSPRERSRGYVKITRRAAYPGNDWDNPEIVDVESVAPIIPPGKLTSAWINLVPPPVPGYQCTVSLVPAEIIPDSNRDGKITGTDRGTVTATSPWRFWINNDDDWGDTGGDDIPQEWSNGFGSWDRDAWDKHVDGVRDLVDFFPIHFDLKAILQFLPGITYQYFLKHETETIASVDGFGVVLPSFNVVWYPEAVLELEPTMPNAVGAYLKNVDGANLIAARPAYTIPAAGLLIPGSMIAAAKLGRGVALLEGRFATTHPLLLEIRTSSGTVVTTIMLSVNISEVEDMFRSKFLADNPNGNTQREIPPSPASPPNWPDANRNGKHFVYLHGYNISYEQARGSNSEFFKRLFWSGSNAMFTGISWHGNESQIPLVFLTPDYWRNVRNAFQTSKSVADFVTALPGSQKAIAAHSLGNMVVSSAIVDHGLVVSQYFMIDAAVALEAYSPTASNKDKMSHPAWRIYNPYLWSTEWHKRFDKTDNRRKMTWRNRFGPLPQAYNFYSSGEEVLKNGDGTVPTTYSVIASGGKLAWVAQEMTKGSSIAGGGGILHNGTGGWDFGTYWDTSLWHILLPTNSNLTPLEACGVPPYALIQHPFFKPFINTKYHDPALGNNTLGSDEMTNYDELSKALAECLPSLSFPAGSNPIDVFNKFPLTGVIRNYDMMTLKSEDKWPRPRVNWLHGDIRSVAYAYTTKVYDIIVKLGNLNK